MRSLAASESLEATASTIRHWLLVEHDGPWGRDLSDARLADGVGGGLRDLERRTGARVLLIRRPGRSRGARTGAVGCHAIDTRAAWLGHAALDRIGDAADLDPRDRTRFADTPGPLFVVCTHGRRDPCCAERGRPLAEALAASAAPSTWESTHVGGDRFAGNVVAFPHGLYFGRVEPEEASTLVRAYGEQRIAPLDRYRGRSSDPFDVQAAEIALRRRLGLDRMDDVRPRRRAKTIDRAETIFSTSAGPYRVRVERAFGEPMRLTCHSAREERPASWRVVDVEPVPAED